MCVCMCSCVHVHVCFLVLVGAVDIVPFSTWSSTKIIVMTVHIYCAKA